MNIKKYGSTARTFKGWSILLPYDDHPIAPLAGVLFWGEPLAYCAAIRTAVFKTKRDAIKAQKQARITKGKLVRVTTIITIESST